MGKILKDERSACEKLDAILKEGGIRVKFGLRAQGHIPKVNFMLAMGATWDEIGRAIGWHGPTVKQFYERFECKLGESGR